MMSEQKVVDTYFEDHRNITDPKMQDSRWRRKHYRKLLPLYPTYVEDFDLREYDLIISSSYLWAKGVLRHPEALHISYVHTPMRQAWVKYHEYLANENDIGSFTRTALRYVMNYLRIWDQSTANRVDHFIANSTVVQQRIEKIYRRKAEVIHPPIKVEQYDNIETTNKRDDYYITVGRLVPYKRVDLLIETFNQLPDRKLYIHGDGKEMQRIKILKESKDRHLKGLVDDDTKAKRTAGARAWRLAAEEDFCMSAVEAMALGTPAVGFGQGGSRDYRQPAINVCFF